MYFSGSYKLVFILQRKTLGLSSEINSKKDKLNKTIIFDSKLIQTSIKHLIRTYRTKS